MTQINNTCSRLSSGAKALYMSGRDTLVTQSHTNTHTQIKHPIVNNPGEERDDGAMPFACNRQGSLEAPGAVNKSKSRIDGGELPDTRAAAAAAVAGSGEWTAVFKANSKRKQTKKSRLPPRLLI